MNDDKIKGKALGLCSGGLDSMLAGMVLERQGVEVVWVSFETPFFNAAKARKASDKTGIPLIVKDITDCYLPMLKNPPAGYGRYLNPCMDCHALMFRMAAEMMEELGADFLFSGEVMGQRPMSQTKSSLRYVEKHSGMEGRILRPLSAKLLPETEMEKKGLVDRDKLCGFSGRSRKPQINLAGQLGITDYPTPAGGCLLTDPGFSRRVGDLLAHEEAPEREDFELLKHGRHIRLSPSVKIVVGRNQQDNKRIFSLYRPGKDVKILMKNVPGPAVLMPGGSRDGKSVEAAASVCAGYSRAPEDVLAEVMVVFPDGASVVAVPPLRAGRDSGRAVL